MESTSDQRKDPSTGLSYIYTGNILTPTRLFICLHGWSCAATDYSRLFTALTGLLSRGDLLVAVDFPGHGDSPKSICNDPTVKAFAALANELRRNISPSDRLLETVIVGHSMGCRVALEAFSQERTNVGALIFLDGGWVSIDQQPLSTSANSKEDKRRIREIFQVMYGPLTPEDFKLDVEYRLVDIDLDYKLRLRAQYVEWDRTRMEVVLQEIKRTDAVKILIVQSTHGRGADRRPLVDDEEGPWIPSVRSNVGKNILTSTVLKGCGHWPHVDKADDVAHRIASFVDEVM